MIVCLAISILAVDVTFSFRGGTDADLVNELHKQLGGPVVLLSERDRIWPKINLAAKTRELLVKRINETTPLRISQRPDGGLGCESSYWPEYVFQKGHDTGSFPHGDKPLFDPKGFLTFTKSDQTLTESDLVESSNGSLRSHWFYYNERFCMSVDHISREAFYELVADAGGAELHKVDGHFSLEFDPKEMRIRTEGLATLEPSGTNAEDEKADNSYLAALYHWLSDKQLRDGYAAPDRTTDFPLTDAPEVQKAAISRVRIHYLSERALARNKASADKIRALLESGNPPVAVLYPNGAPSIMLGDKTGYRIVL